MTHEIPDEWFIDHDGQSRVLDPAKVEHLFFAAKTVFETFKKDEDAGYRSRDRQYAIDILSVGFLGVGRS